MNQKNLFVYIILILSGLLFSQISDGFNHPELQWKTFETEHFVFHYHEGTEKTANRFANVAEHVYDTISNLYDYKLDKKLHVIVNDYDDFAQGGAYYYNNKISLWAPNLDTELRGTHDWFKNVFTHEFAHMMQLDAPKKAGSFIPGMYIQWMGYEKEKRKDVLTGYPNVIGSYNIPMNIIPSWFAEGVAQNQYPDMYNHDFWDSHRDMILRERMLSGLQFSYSKVSDYGNKTSHEAETVYNTGFAFVRYLMDTYGVDTPRKISEEMGKFSSFSFENAIERVVGVNGEELYNEWVAKKTSEYQEKVKTIEANLTEGNSISDGGFVQTHPKYSPDGKKLAYLSTLENGEVTFYRRSLYVKDLETGETEIVFPAIMFSSISWSPDSKKLYYAKYSKFSIYGNFILDLYEYDFETEEETRLTEGLRATNPEISADGNKIAFVASNDGTQNLYVLDLETDEVTNITQKDDGTQYYIPQFTKDGKHILVGTSDRNYGRNIVLLDLEGNIVESISTPYDERHPVFSSDEKYIYYSSDKTGIFNIYRYNRETKENELLTNVRGGAFYPDIKDDKLVYSNYKGIKFELYEVTDIKPLDESIAQYIDYKVEKEYSEIPNIDYVKDAVKYDNDFENLFLIPRIAFDNEKFKPGFYFFINDYLEKVSLFGGAAMRPDNFDYDIYMDTEFRFLLPTVYGVYMNQVKHDESTFNDSTVIVGVGQDENGNEYPLFKQEKYKYRYDLKIVNAGLRFPLSFNWDVLEKYVSGINIDAFYEYSRYSAEADNGETKLNYNYYKDKSIHFKVILDKPARGLHSDINPTNGRVASFKFSNHNTKFMDGFEVNSNFGTLQEDYKSNNYNMYTLDWIERFKLPLDVGLSASVKATYLDADSIDTFYNNYIGGLEGVKGYSFYSIGGTRTLYSALTFRFPIIERVDKKLGFFNFKKMFGGVFVDAGAAWTYRDDDNLSDYIKDNLRKSVGIELRILGVSFYNMPTTLNYSAAYGLDEFVDEDVKYGKEVRHYFALLFNFANFFGNDRQIDRLR